MNLKNQSLTELYSKSKLINDLLIILAIGIFIGYLAPFGMDHLPVWISILYWVVTCICGYLIYTPLIHMGEILLEQRIKLQWVRVALSTFIASILMSFVVPVIGWALFENNIDYSKQFLAVLPKAIIIGGVITFISMVQNLIKRQKEQLVASEKKQQEQQQKADKATNQQLDKLIAQLPIEKRGELICLEMSDHYLKVYTDKGHHLLLMRFKDALDILIDYPGLQTHRSWWVAKSAIISLKKDGRKTFLILANQLEVPVSRTFVEAVKAANIR